jgi:starch synthase (maltosyl-transferring)
VDISGKARQRVMIEHVQPELDGGQYPIKRVVGEKIVVIADIFADGHDALSAQLLYRHSNLLTWNTAPMRLIENDRWLGEFMADRLGVYYYTLEGWIDRFKTWQRDFKKKVDAAQDIQVDIGIGAGYIEEAAKQASGADETRLIKLAKALRNSGDFKSVLSIAFGQEIGELMERYLSRQFATRYTKELAVIIDRPKALFSAWYERFPRSCSPDPKRHGTLSDCEQILPEIAGMGFDVFYLSPIHPIGNTNRKGKNNSPTASPDDPGSPWAIGSEEGGHTVIHPQLGTLDDFDRLVRKAKQYGMEIAMDLAFQCSPDHPYLKSHPEWFRWRPDGTVQFAENPPKKYEDILPINFETDDWQALWEELKGVVLFWISHGIRIFRVDNPHTKPFVFWEWLISGIKREYPDVIFLSEAFTRPGVMYKLAKLGFSQSYTYFTWRTGKHDLISYLTELTRTEVRDYFRPNFWPNTPDILPEHLQYGGKSAFLTRLVLAATLSSNYGIYGPAFELCIGEATGPGKEEYLNSEKYEVKHWNWNAPGNLKDFIARVNRIRRKNPALQNPWNLRFYEVDNEQILVYGKATEDLANIILVVINLDPHYLQSGWVRIPIETLGIDPNQTYLVHDLLSDEKYTWQGERNYVQLDPHIIPAHIFSVKQRLKRETDFDYFM